MSHIPTTFWSRVIAQLTLFAQNILEASMMNSASCPQVSVQPWAKGIVIYWKDVGFDTVNSCLTSVDRLFVIYLGLSVWPEFVSCC